MSTPSNGFDMSRFHFVRAPGLNRKDCMRIAKLYLETGRLRQGIQLLDFARKIDRLRSLVAMLQCSWGAAAGTIKSQLGKPDEGLGELSAGSVFGEGVTDKISGKDMLRAVVNMVVLVVNGLQNDSPERVPNEQIKSAHKDIAVAMFVEALYALQDDQKSAFRTALFGDSLAKVEVYSSIEQRRNEGDAAFRLRTVEQELEESEAIRRRNYEAHKLTIVRYKKEVEKTESLQHSLDVDRRLMHKMAGDMIKLEQDLKEERSKRTQFEHDLKKLKEESSKITQLGHDPKQGEHKATRVEHDVVKDTHANQR